MREVTILNELTIDDFTPLIGEVFVVTADESLQLQTVLTSAQPLGRGAPANGARTPFSLVFTDASRTHLPQKIYRLETAKLPPMDLFLVPIGPDQNGMRYEAIFT